MSLIFSNHCYFFLHHNYVVPQFTTAQAATSKKALNEEEVPSLSRSSTIIIPILLVMNKLLDIIVTIVNNIDFCWESLMVSWNEVTETQMTIAPFQNQSWKIILRCECPNRVDKNHKHLGSNSFAIVG